jgi:hypothetical protein
VNDVFSHDYTSSDHIFGGRAYIDGDHQRTLLENNPAFTAAPGEVQTFIIVSVRETLASALKLQTGYLKRSVASFVFE